jgi:hypothetical protein
MLSRRAALAFGIADLMTAGLVLLGVFVALPARWWPVDAAAAALGVLELGAGVSLLVRPGRAEPLARVASVAALGLGLFVVSVLALTASWLSGVYGPVGEGGAIIFFLVAALALPYLVVLPAVQLVWLRRPKGRTECRTPEGSGLERTECRTPEGSGLERAVKP